MARKTLRGNQEEQKNSNAGENRKAGSPDRNGKYNTPNLSSS